MHPDGDLDQASIGKRVEYNGSYGTLKYVGEVPSTKGLWLGIDWDDPSRGKHDGTYEGIRYFTTRYPTSGSFVRHGKANFGESFAHAIRDKYGVVQGNTAGVDERRLASIRKEINARFFEVVGFDKVNRKQSQFEVLRVVCLREMLVNGAGEEGELEELCPSIEELDLTKNLLPNWESVASIAIQLKKLEVLNLSENRLDVPEDNMKQLSEAFQSLQHIILGRMDLTWQDILACALMWPQIQILQVPYNRITSLETSNPDIFAKLTFLDLSDNPIEDWAEINKLGFLHKLQILILSGIPVTDISFPDCPSLSKTKLFPNLRKMILTENKINRWEAFNELDKLAQLEDLAIRECPVLDKESLDTGRQIIVAKVTNLKVLNGCPVENDERRGAEVDYLKKFGRGWFEAGGSHETSTDNKLLQTFLESHPKYPVLVQKYGAPEESEVLQKPATLKNMLITLTIYSEDSSVGPFVKKVPETMKIQRLKGMVQRLFNTAGEIPTLCYISEKEPDVVIPLEHDLRMLSYYSVENGGKICVQW